MGLIGPIRGGGSLPPRHMAPREGDTPPLWRTPSLSLWFSTTWDVEGGWHPPLAYIRRGRGAHFFITFDLRQVSLIFSFPPFSSSSGLPLFGVYTWLGFLHHTHAVVLLESGSKSIFFPPLFWFGARRESRVHRMRVIPRGATLVVLLHR